MTWTIQGSGELPTYQGSKTITGTLTVQGQAGFADGTVGAPGIAFTSDLDTGLYRIGANNIGVAANGAKVLDIATTGLTITGTLTPSGQTLAADGTVFLPGLSYSSDPDTGFFRDSAQSNTVFFVGNGARAIWFRGVTLQLGSTGILAWGSTILDNGTANDLLLVRDAANTLAQRNGTTAQVSRWYETFTDASNYARISASAAAGGPYVITPEAAGTGTLRGMQFGATSTAVGFMGATPVVRQTSAANLTNSVTSGGTDDTIADFTNLTVYATDAAAIRNDIYQLARKLKQVNDALRLYGLLS